jgi:L-threonylcarbamoyladenylate synthase
VRKPDLAPFGIGADQLSHAAQLLREGKLVAFPTETVYGLGANALDAAAVERIFRAKGRPHSSPIIVHVSDYEMVKRVAAAWPETAKKLADQFWPGPLTLVLPKTPAVPDRVTASLPSVGVRMPAHSVALALIRAAQVPVAAPSANRFTHVSPTTAEHVRYSLGDRVDYILDGGTCTVGIESTVLSLAEDTPVLYRPGGISRRQIAEVIGPIATAKQAEETEAHASPGLHLRHYSPRTALILVANGKVPGEGSGAYLQLTHPPYRKVSELVTMPDNPAGYAAKLYGVLHALDARAYDWIAVDTPSLEAEWEAVLDRLHRAAFGGSSTVGIPSSCTLQADS